MRAAQPREGHGMVDLAEPGQINSDDFPIQKEQRALRLVLRGRSDRAVDVQVRRKCLGMPGPQLCGMPLAMAKDEASNPFHVRSLGANVAMLDVDLCAHLGRQARGMDVIHKAGPAGPTLATRCLDCREVSLGAGCDFLPIVAGLSVVRDAFPCRLGSQLALGRVQPIVAKFPRPDSSNENVFAADTRLA